MTSAAPTTSHGDLLYRPAGSGATFLGPGDTVPVPRHRRGVRRRVLRDGGVRAAGRRPAAAHSPPRGGDVLHRRGADRLPARRPGRSPAVPGDFVNVPRGTVHRFHNSSTAAAKISSRSARPTSSTSSRRRSSERSTRHAVRGRQPRRGGGPLRRRRPALWDGVPRVATRSHRPWRAGRRRPPRSSPPAICQPGRRERHRAAGGVLLVASRSPRSPGTTSSSTPGAPFALCDLVDQRVDPLTELVERQERLDVERPQVDARRACGHALPRSRSR